MGSLHFHDTLTGRKREFIPGDPKRVTMYVCGPTVYSYAHIGNARPAVVFDVLYHLLKRTYGEDHVVYARNITDVEDKIIAAMKATGASMKEITGKYADIYNADMGAVGAAPPTIEPYATDHIGDIIAMIEKLAADGHAYAAEGHVLFSVRSYADYGKLSKRDMDDMIAGARVEVAPYKKDPADFVLWKPAKDDEPGWDSPWGRGRPGWHIECSAMCEKHLGETIDIHGGGNDLTFPHHENEIAQSVCAHGGTPMARYWLHNGMLAMTDEKMSKSLGNVKLVHELIEHWPGEVLRYALLTAHYRAPLDWTDALLERSQKSLDRLYGVLRRIKAEPGDVPETVEAALADDLNTPKALAALFALAGEANRAEDEAEQMAAAAALLAGGQALGLLNGSPDAWFGIDSLSEAERAEIDQLIADRTTARKARDFAKADALRDELIARKIKVEDGPEGSTWRMG
ncbi:cysteine--tRNA ligase [Hyphobacterium sp. HN65]|uniref:Cysteine--tRNA ligase n=1 Tax=Hyphobacterium lacteum TaxID=3116575 RepID=A0ABU7LQ00_9PROT|nr:cysteine--tRNA ligase [Hyphobacterium sp. HN65]MEE2525981.1 cysteine--tRNA ligase [Hyphobacterium sp. HN65]